MMKRIIALLLALILTVGLLPTVALATTGDEETTANPITNPDPQTANGVTLSKTAAKNADGTYTIRLEAYARGSSTTTETTEEVPTDIILVLDRSNSMNRDMGKIEYKEYTGRARQNGNLYKKGENVFFSTGEDAYVPVTITQSETTVYTPFDAEWTSNSRYYDYRNNLYAKVGDDYKKVNVSRERIRGSHTYTYTLEDGKVIANRVNGDYAIPTFTGIDGKGLYHLEKDNVYTYTYVDADGKPQTLGTSTGDDTQFTDKVLYYQQVNSNGGGTRMKALKDAATNFVESVAKKAKGTGGKTVEHRIAVVSFASDVSNDTQGFKSMTNTADVKAVKDKIDQLSAGGGTLVDKGIETANDIFKANPLSATEKRNRVMIVFTDGAPGSYGDWKSESVETANSAIRAAYATKNTYQATVFTIGIFAGAKNELQLPDYTRYTNGVLGAEVSPSDADQTKNSNRFMHLVSTNYPEATDITTPNTPNSKPGYYLTASDSAALNNVFQQISDQIQDVTTTDLDASAAVTDTVGDSFSFDGKAESYAVKVAAFEKEENGQYTFSSNETTDTKVKADIKGKTISVTGFSFKDEWCGYDTKDGKQTPHGRKLIIELKVTADAAGCDDSNIPTNNGNAKIVDKEGKTAVEIASPTVRGYQVTYDKGTDDTVTNMPADSAYFINGTTVADKEPTRAGYTFTGWNMTGDTTGKTYEAGDGVSFNGSDVELVAQWTAKTLAVDLGAFVKKNFTMTEGKELPTPGETFKVTVTQTKPAAEGATAPSYEGTVIVQKNGTYAFDFATNITNPTLTYGEDYEFSVSEEPGTNPSINYDDESYTLKLGLQEVTENGEKKIVAVGSPVTIENSYIETYTLTYDSNGGTGEVPTDSINYTSGQTATLKFDKIPTHADSAEGNKIVFLGWSAEQDTEIHESKPSNLIYEIQMTDNKTVYAVWGYDKNNNDNPDFYDAAATYNIVGGKWEDDTTSKTETVKVKTMDTNGEWKATNETLKAVPDTTKVKPSTDYTSTGSWGSETPVNNTTVITRDTTYTYTLQKTEKVTVTYEWTGLPEDDKFEAGKKPTLPTPNPVEVIKGGSHDVDQTYTSMSTVTDVHGNVYKFSGWDQKGTITVQENTTIRGTWTKSTGTFDLTNRIFKSFTEADGSNDIPTAEGLTYNFEVKVTRQDDSTDVRYGSATLKGNETEATAFNFAPNHTLTFDKAGIYTYSVEENSGYVSPNGAVKGNIINDARKYQLTIKVDGNLDVEAYSFIEMPAGDTPTETVPTGELTITFKNKYDEDPNADIVTLDLGNYVTKTFESRHGKSATETFEAKVQIWLEDVPVINAAKEEDAIAVYAEPEWPKEYTGTVTLSTGETKPFDFGGSITLDRNHRYRIRVTETAGSNTDVEYDKTVYETYVNFDYETKEVKWYEYNGNFSFTNTYTGIDDYYPIIIPSIINKDTGMLNKTDHFAYVIGYPDGTVHPNGQITRAEVATIFFRLLKDEVRDGAFTTSNSYSDVAYGKWYNNPISTMSALGIITGYPDGTFKPNKPITRAEFAAIAARFDETQSGKSATFSDVIGHWAAKEIGIAYYNDWIKGYPDGTFKPDQNITRAEAMTLINRVLERKPESPADLLTNMNKWTDNMDTSKWYYLDVQEATNSHGYTRKTFNYELWRQMLPDPDWSRYER